MAVQRTNKNLVLGVSGSVAAYKSAEIARLFVIAGWKVRAIMTHSAREFLGAATLEAITGAPVVTGFWDGSESGSIGHIQLADWASCVLVAPATADLLAKMTYGFAEGPLLATLLATKSPIAVAPAMNCNMWDNPATTSNVKTLRARGVQVISPQQGSLACGWEGIGRLASPQSIFDHVESMVKSQDLLGRRVLIAAGPTREPIDAVRFISNRSSGKMGLALAQEAQSRGAAVTLVLGPVEIEPPLGVTVRSVTTAREMYEAMIEEAGRSFDLIVMAAAVADFRPREEVAHKLKGSRALTSVELTANPDILASLGEKRRGASPLLVGFSVETGRVDDMIREAHEKRRRKGADFIIANLASEAFERDENRVWIACPNDETEEVPLSSKRMVAERVLDRVVKSLHSVTR